MEPEDYLMYAFKLWDTKEKKYYMAHNKRSIWQRKQFAENVIKRTLGYFGEGRLVVHQFELVRVLNLEPQTGV